MILDFLTLNNNKVCFCNALLFYLQDPFDFEKEWARQTQSVNMFFDAANGLNTIAKQAMILLVYRW